MPLLEVLLLRLVMWVLLPALLIVLAIGPARVANGWRRFTRWVFDRRDEPGHVLDRVVRQHQTHIQALRQVIAQAEAAKSEIEKNQRTSETALENYQREAEAAVARHDDLGARGALYRLNLEKMATQGFSEQLARVEERIDQARKRLYLLELQLRQYEVGRSILLSQLAEAKTVEQQYALVNQFDPFSAVAAWQETEGVVREAAQHARAAEQVMRDTADLALAGRPLHIDPTVLDEQLAQMESRPVRRNGPTRD